MSERTDSRSARTPRTEAPRVADRGSAADAAVSREDLERFERARKSRDSRFDGRFFVGVLTTGIYCRPICPARAAKRENVEYFRSAAAAAASGLRPCLRCHPEAAPGSPAWLGTSATVSKALRWIDEGALDVDTGSGESGRAIEMLARRVGVTDRHLRRLFLQHLGAPPLAIAVTRRLHFARRLLDDTALPITDVAFAAGFGSLRRFNQAFRDAFGAPPSRLRGAAPTRDHRGELSLRVPVRLPFDWSGTLGFLQHRAIPGVEEIRDDVYRRNFRSGELSGRLTIEGPSPRKPWLRLGLVFDQPPSPLPSLVGLVQRVRNLFDVDADPVSIAEQLSPDPVLEPRIAARPGLRVPGAWDGFELAVRAVLGQQITVKGATTLAGRLVELCGDRVPDSIESGDLRRLFPTPAAMASAPLRTVGLPAARAKTLKALARAVDAGELDFDQAPDPDDRVERLLALPGIGDWTAQYVAMRALRQPDAFPAGDLGLRKAVGVEGRPASVKSLTEQAEKWRPWRAYAAMLLWLPAPTDDERTDR